jgi:galactose-1-phosphate uridylyltransferase
MAPKFNPKIVPEGRISVGEAVGFPSLFAHEDHNAVVVPTRLHKISLHQMPPRMFFEGFKACIEYFRRLYAWNSKVKSDAIVMNFYPPAGSTIAHPHLQALASDIPLQATDVLVKASEAYFNKFGSSYWSDLVREEQRLNERYLARHGSVNWITPFAPSGLSEVQAIIFGVSDLGSIPDEDLRDLADGVARILRGYHEAGIRSFNMAIYSGPFAEDADYFDLNLVMVARYGYKPRFVSDIWALQYLLGEQEVFEAPEETCSRLRKYFD